MITKELQFNRHDPCVGSDERPATQDAYGNPVEPPYLYRMHLEGGLYIPLPANWDPEIQISLKTDVRTKPRPVDPGASG